MIQALERIIVSATDVSAAAAAYAGLFGRTSDTARFDLANTALEVVAAKDGAEGLAGLVFLVPDLDGAREGFSRRGLTFAADGDDGVTWLDTASTFGVSLGVVDSRSPPVSGEVAPDAVNALDHVVIRAGDADRAVALYGARLGLDFRLDRSNPQWGARLLFFRCGESVIEISAPLGAGDTPASDRLDGLAWRVTDPVATRSRLLGEGFDVSEVRKGRKPGTAVFTLRSGLVGAPSLLIGPSEASLPGSAD